MLHLKIGGSGSADPPTVSFPGAYSAEDPVNTLTKPSNLTFFDVLYLCVGHPYQHLYSTRYLSEYGSPCSHSYLYLLIDQIIFIVPGPTPYATTSPTVATTPYPTTATWNTALQPSTVPTTVPTSGAQGIGKA